MKVRTILAAAASAALLSLGGAAPAMASDNANATPLYANSISCHGAPVSSQTAANQEGFVNFHLDGTTVTLSYHVKDAAPGSTFYVYGYDSFCHYDAYLGSVKTNGNGVANADFTYTIPAGATEVWTFANGAGLVETPAVTP